MSEILGAPASSAGDEFHELWALRKVLGLLDPGSNLVSVTVEGVPSDLSSLELGQKALAVDVTEVRRNSTVTEVVFEQLKYSTSHPTTAWTWHRLTAEKTKGRSDTSVIGKLARAFTAAARVSHFRIVTNQPLAAEVCTELPICLDALRGRNAIAPAALSSLRLCTGLSDDRLADFLEAFDLSGFGNATRLHLETEILHVIGQTLDADARDDLVRLQERISALILPENRNRAEIDRETLLTWLGAGASEIMFPAPNEIRPATPMLRRKILDDLLRALTSSENRLVRLHADGGCGKTTLVSGLLEELPAGSELFLYDCYGGGLFLASDRRRHLPTQAFVQTANELAGRLGSPFVLRRSGLTDLTAGYRRRLEASSQLLHARSPAGLLVLVFDAVDNARIASKHWQQDCFLDELLGMSDLPQNVRVILTYRTARSTMIGSSTLIGCEMSLSPFTFEETRSFVRLHQSTWSDTVIQELHDLTGGVPRRLAYALEGLSNEDAQTAIERLMPKAPGLDPLFQKRVQEAGLRIGDREAVWRLLCALGNMPRPVPSWALAQITNILEADISDLASDLGGIVRHEDGWTFQDEDFEAFARDQTAAIALGILQQAAQLLYSQRHVERYAARSVAEILMRADRVPDLYRLVLANELPGNVSDPVERRAILARRLVLALNCARHASNNLDAGSLLLQAARGLKTDKLISDLLVRHLALSVVFSPTELTRLILTDRRRRRERGRLRLHLALHSALAGDAPAARDHLRWWDAWIRDWLATEPKHREAPTLGDITLEFEATYALDGFQAALDRLLRWRPRTIAFKVARSLIAKAAVAGRCHDILTVFNARHWPSDISLALLHGALMAGAKLDDAAIDILLGALRRVRPPNLEELGQYAEPSPLILSEAMLLMEYVAQFQNHHSAVLVRLDRLFPPNFMRAVNKLPPLLETLDLHSRAIALRERLTQVVEPLESYLPPTRAVPSESQTTQLGRRLREKELSDAERRARDDAIEWNLQRDTGRSVLNSLLKAARERLSRTTRPSSIVSDIIKTLDKFDDPRRNRGERASSEAIKRFKRTWAIDLALQDKLNIDDLSKLIQPKKPYTVLDDIEAISITKGAGSAVCECLANTSIDWQASSGTASERAAVLMRCAAIAQKFDLNLAENLFRRGLELTEKTDMEVVAQLHAACALTEIKLDSTREQRVAIAERLADTGGIVAATLGDESELRVPWTQILRSCATLDPSTALAALGRWRDVGIVSLIDSIEGLSQADVGFSSLQRLALAGLSGTDAMPLLTTAATEYTARSALLSGRATEVEAAAEKLQSLQQGLLSGSWQRKLAAAAVALEQFRADIGEHRSEEEIGAESQEHESPAIKDIAEVEREIAAWRNVEDASYRRYDFDSIAQRASSVLIRTPILSVFAANFPRDRSLVEFFLRILPEWRRYPPVSTWAAEALPTYLSHALPDLFEWQYHDTALLEAALAATGLSKKHQADIILKGVEINADSLSAELLFALVGVFGKLSDATTRVGLLDHLLAQITRGTDKQPFVTITGASAPEDSIEATTRFLFALMADVDKRIRWRAAHVIRLLAAHEDVDVTTSIMNLLKVECESVFSAPTVPFYYLAARQQLVVTLHRIALERPASLRSHAHTLAQIAIDGPPHVIIQQFAKMAALVIEKASPGALTATTVKEIARVNVSQFRKVKEKRRSFQHRDYRKTLDALRYHFDSTDTIPYWFEPAASVFGIFVPEFAQHAERWICDVWALQPDSWKWLSEARTRRFDEDSYDLASHRHGSEPIIERLARYAEWHAMLCTMGELLIAHPIVRSSYGDDFEGWLSRYGLTEPGTWLSDLRTPPPLEARFWGLCKPEENAEENWLVKPEHKIFDQELDPAGAGKSIIVRAETSVTTGRLVEHVSISSALVTNETAVALGRALQTVRDPMDYCIPPSNDSREIKEAGYTLQGWLTDSERSPHLEMADTARGVVSGVPFRPAQEILKKMGLSLDCEGHGWRRDHSAEPELKFAWWGNSEEDDGKSSGWRGTASRSLLMDLLNSFNKSLILDVEITRRIKREHRRQEDKRRRSRRLYILRPDGNLHRIDDALKGPACYWVRKLGLEPGVDTLGRWMIHRVEELEHKRSKARGGQEKRLRDELHHTLQRLVEHRVSGRR